MNLASAAASLGNVGSAAGRFLGAGLDGLDITNSLFSSLVAITGDAHQAQVAQDIFRQEVRIERSLRIREDIRDAHKLMIENVQTQLLMGNIVLGVCFAVLVEGRPSDPDRAPVIVQELWATFSVWAIAMTFVSIWFALRFQEIVSTMARKRLLEKHRICMPNDEVVGRMGGLSLAQQVARLHQEGLNRLTQFLTSTASYENPSEFAKSWLSAGIGAGDGDDIERPVARKLQAIINHALSPCQPEVAGRCGSCQQFLARCRCSELTVVDSNSAMQDIDPEASASAAASTRAVHSDSSVSALTAQTKSGGLTSFGSGASNAHSLREDDAGEDHVIMEQVIRDTGVWQQLAPELNLEVCFNKSSQPVETVRAGRGTQAWYDDSDKPGDSSEWSTDCPRERDFDKSKLMDAVIVDMPDFLVDEALVRCPWQLLHDSDNKGFATVHIRVEGAATLYVAAQWPERQSGAYRGFGPPQKWPEKQMPKLLKGAYKFKGKEKTMKFHRVEGFSIYVSKGKMELPIYRCALDNPDSSGWLDAKLQFRFSEAAVAPIIIARHGQITTSEEDWPVTEFIRELDEIQPLREHSMHYMSLGLLNLLLGAFFAHLGRVLTDRPWPACQKEVIVMLLALLPALLFSADSHRIMRMLFSVDITSRSYEKASNTIAAGSLPEAHIEHAGQKDEEIPEKLTESPGTLSNDAEKIDTVQSIDGHIEDQTKAARGLASSMSNGPAAGFLGGCVAMKSCNAVEADAVELQVVQDNGAPDCPGIKLSALDTDSQRTPPRRDGGFAVDLLERTSSPNSKSSRKSLNSDEDSEDDLDAEAEREKHRRVSSASIGSVETLEGSSTTSQGSRNAWCFSPLPIWCTRLVLFKIAVMVLQVSSILWLFAGFLWDPTLRGSDDDIGKTSDQHCWPSGSWLSQKVDWPSPFFSPTAAALSPDGALWVASDWLLYRVGSPGRESQRVRVPAAARGLFMSVSGNASRLAVAGQEAVHSIGLPGALANASQAKTRQSALRGMVAMADPAAVPIGRVLALPSALPGPITSAASAPLPATAAGAPSSLDVVAVASADAGEVFLLAAVDLAQLANGHASSGDLAVAVRVPLTREASASIQALHLCTDTTTGCGAGQPVLWAVIAERRESIVSLLAYGLETGEVLARLPWPRGHPQARPLALAGNTTHLIAVARCGAGASPPVVLSATYGSLLASD